MDSLNSVCLYFTVPSLFDPNALSLSICRMASDVTIWVKVEDGRRGRATSLDVSCTLTIDRLVTAVLKQEKLDTAPDLVTVEFEGVEIRGGQLVTEFTTSDENPLLLKCPDDCEGV